MLRSLAFVVFLYLLSVQAQDYHEKRPLDLEGHGLTSIEIRNGAGEIEISCAKTDRIQAEAEIILDRFSEKEIQRILDHDMDLSLRAAGSKARLNAEFDFQNSWRLLDYARAEINLKVTVPEGMALRIEDGSGEITIRNYNGDISIDDGSGAIFLNGIEAVLLDIEDGSGGMELEDITGETTIDDGSGDIIISRLTGNLQVDDGSGGLECQQVKGNVSTDDGSGNMLIEKVRGSVKIKDGSGSVDIEQVSGDVEIFESGSGGVHISEVEGQVIRHDEDD